jgi:DNA-binding MarR family transcriptional regulator
MPDSPAPVAPDALLDAVRAIARLTRVVNPAAGDLSHADYRAMSIIRLGEVRASRLAARLALGKATISATIESLARRGLVERADVPEDSRATELSLSQEGIDLLDLVEGRMARQLELLCERTPDAGQVVQSLSWLGEVIAAAVTDRIERAERIDDAQAAASGPADGQA